MTSSKHKQSDFAHEDLDGYDSSFEDEESEEKLEQKTKRQDLAKPSQKVSTYTTSHSAAIPPKTFLDDQLRRAEGYRNTYFSLNAFERHQKLINDYFLYFPGAKRLFERDTSKDKRDIDVIRDHHRFLWNEDSDEADTWEKQLAKKYYDKLYKEYTICDLSRFKENKLAMRWRIERELLDGKGQFTCGSKHCTETDNLRTWEVNFAYMEESVKKNALVKLRLCPECSLKLNYCRERKEVTKKSKKRKSSSSRKDKRHKRKRRDTDEEEDEAGTSKSTAETGKEEEDDETAGNVWKAPVPISAAKSREEEFDEYLDDLFV